MCSLPGDPIGSVTIAGHTVILLTQNGTDIDRLDRQRYCNNAIVSAVTLIGANEASSGSVLHDELETYKIGALCDTVYETNRPTAGTDPSF